jgi:predicted nucleotide-binding protein
MPVVIQTETMPKFVPSRVRMLLDQRFPFAKEQIKGGPGADIPPDYAGALLQLLQMLDDIPEDPPALTDAARVELGEAIQSVRAAVAAWSAGDRTQPLRAMVGKNGWSPLTFIRKHMEALSDETPREGEPASTAPPDRRTVFVVHGRNLAARTAMFEFLRAVGLRPLEWEQAVSLTGNASPYVLDVIRVGFAAAQAIVVLFTPDDLVRLDPNLRSAQDTAEAPAGQPRPNVLLEAGMALERNRERTVIVEFGEIRGISDLRGIHDVRISAGSVLPARNQLASRLRNAGCEVDTSGTDWLTAGDLDAALIGGSASVPTPGDSVLSHAAALTKSVQRALADPHARYFDPRAVTPFFERYHSLRDALLALGGAFAELGVHPVPKASETTDFDGRGYVLRVEIELLLSDLEYGCDLLAHAH